jgi:hypothetical protein
MVHRRFFLAVCTLYTIAACTPSEWPEKYCSARFPPRPLVSVETKRENFYVRSTKTRQEVTQDLNNSGKVVSAGQALGATTGEYEQKTLVSMGEALTGPGFFCAAPKIDVVLVLKAPVVDISREFLPGTCRYQTILRHELQHVNTYGSHLEQSKILLTDAIFKKYAEKPYVLADSMSALQQNFAYDTRQWLVPTVSEQLAKVREKQLMIDTPEEYEALTAACPEEPLSNYR